MAITKIIGFFLPALGNEAVAKARARELPSLIAKTTGCRELSQTVEDAFEVCGNSLVRSIPELLMTAPTERSPGRCEPRPLGLGSRWAHSRQHNCIGIYQNEKLIVPVTPFAS
jgi:hypothetical protein